MIKAKSARVYWDTSNTYPPVYRQPSIDLSQFLAEHDIELIYGDRKQGLMSALAESVLDNIRFSNNNLFSVLKRVGDFDPFILALNSNQDNYVNKFA